MENLRLWTGDLVTGENWIEEQRLFSYDCVRRVYVFRSNPCFWAFSLGSLKNTDQILVSRPLTLSPNKDSLEGSLVFNKLVCKIL